MSGIDTSCKIGKVISHGTRDIQSYALLGMWTNLSSFLDIRACIRHLFPNVKLPNPIPIDVEVLVGLIGGTSTLRNVLLIRMEDVENGAEFA